MIWLRTAPGGAAVVSLYRGRLSSVQMIWVSTPGEFYTCNVAPQRQGDYSVVCHEESFVR